MNKRQLEALLKRILSIPTAPFHEYHVRKQVIEELEKIENVTWKFDGYGNVIAQYRLGTKRAKYAFGAHMDHPGFVKNGSGEFEFLGGVPEATVDHCREQIIDHGDFAVWDVEEFALRAGKVVARACDDLIGCVVMLALFGELASKKVEANVYALFTRAEEVGFLGAVAMAKNWPLPKGVRFVSLETSTPRAAVKVGEGPVLRVGDRLSVFDHEITATLEWLARKHRIPVQRALLDGGACEASALQAYGIQSGGISVALENYHNVAENNEVAPEAVSYSDVSGLIDLLVQLFADKESAKLSPYPMLRKRLAERARAMEKHRMRAEKLFV